MYLPLEKKTSWNPLGHTGPVTGLLYLYFLLIRNIMNYVGKSTITEVTDQIICSKK